MKINNCEKCDDYYCNCHPEPIFWKQEIIRAKEKQHEKIPKRVKIQK